MCAHIKHRNGIRGCLGDRGLEGPWWHGTEATAGGFQEPGPGGGDGNAEGRPDFQTGQPQAPSPVCLSEARLLPTLRDKGVGLESTSNGRVASLGSEITPMFSEESQVQYYNHLFTHLRSLSIWVQDGRAISVFFATAVGICGALNGCSSSEEWNELVNGQMPIIRKKP